MTTSSFSEYFEQQTNGQTLGDGTPQNLFSVHYTAWLTSILNDEAADWLESQNLDIVGGFTVKLNQNDSEGAPYIEYLDSNNELQTFSLEDLFTGDKLDFDAQTGKVRHTRYYFDTFDVPGVEENQAPTDIHITIDAAFAAAVAGSGGDTKDSANTTTGDGPLLIGLLSAVDPNVGDTHTFEIVDDPSGRFVIKNDNELMLDEGESIAQGDGTFTLTIKVTDLGGLSYFETFTFTTGVEPVTGKDGTTGADDISGTAISGDGSTQGTAVLGDDLVFGFVQNDTLIGSSGDDALFGGRGTDMLDGGAGNDQLFGGFNGDTLIGGAGDDTLVGGVGDDVLQGDEGADTFVFSLAGDDGDDTINDFNRTEDILQFNDVFDVGGNGLTFADVDAAISNFVNGGVGGDVTVNFNNGASITLIGAGTAGLIDSIADLVDNAAAQIIVT